MLNSLSSVAVLLYVLLLQKVLLCNSNTSIKTEFCKKAYVEFANYGTPMIALSVKLHRLQKEN
jgi:hypothetical protein